MTMKIITTKTMKMMMIMMTDDDAGGVVEMTKMMMMIMIVIMMIWNKRAVPHMFLYQFSRSAAFQGPKPGRGCHRLAYLPHAEKFCLLTYV